MSEVSIVDEDSTYPFKTRGFSEPIRTKSEACQRWFDRGLMQAFNFNHDEAVLCFQAAAKEDPECPMAWWGIAYASGVNYNKAAFLNDSEAEVAVDAIDRANALVAAESSSSMGQGNGSSSDGGNASAMTAASLEKALCESLAHRYSGLKGVPVSTLTDDSYASRNLAYVNAFRPVYLASLALEQATAAAGGGGGGGGASAAAGVRGATGASDGNDEKEPSSPSSSASSSSCSSVSSLLMSPATMASLHAEALMQLRPWKLWGSHSRISSLEAESEGEVGEGEGSSHGAVDSDTLEAVGALERALKYAPSHPGLCHLYVHAMEMSPTPGAACGACDYLRRDFPDHGHLLHMASHIDMEVGKYGEAVLSNQKAVAADLIYCGLRGHFTYYHGYLVHNYHMLNWAAMYDGQSAVALEAALMIEARTPQSMLEQYAEFLEPYCAGKWHTWVRFGKWHEILKCPLPGGEVDWVPEEGKEERKETEKEQGKETEKKQEGNVDEAKAVERADIGGENTNEEGQEGEGEDPQAKGPKKLDLGASFWRTCRATAYYAKGVACAALGDVQGAEQMQAKFASAKAVVGPDRCVHNVTSLQSLAVAEKVLEGEIAFRRGGYANTSAALQSLREAVELEDALPYDEPWGWMVPSRHALAALLCDAAAETDGVPASAADANVSAEGANNKTDVSSSSGSGSGARAGGATTGEEMVACLKEAEAVCRADLVKRPNNLWALKGLARALKAQEFLGLSLGTNSSTSDSSSNHYPTSQAAEKAAQIAGARADIPITAACFCAQVAGAAPPGKGGCCASGSSEAAAVIAGRRYERQTADAPTSVGKLDFQEDQ